MRRLFFFLLVPLLATGCRCPQTEPGISSADGDARGFKVVSRCSGDESDLDSLVRFVEELKRSGHDIHRITRIRFASRTKARVDFLWSGGFHAGELEVAQEREAWALLEEHLYP